MRVRRQSAQGLIEFAIISMVLMLMFFGIIDFGRAIYYYITMEQAVNEGLRVAVRAPTPPAPNGLTADNTKVFNAVTAQATAMTLATPTCTNGPIDSNTPPANVGWVYITQPNGTATPPAANAPGGQSPTTPVAAGCATVAPAGFNGQYNVPLEVTIRYNFVPITPLVGQVFQNQLILTAYAVYRTEY